MPRKGENIYKRKDGRWEGRFIKFTYPNEKSKYGYIYGKSYMEVKDKLNRAKALAKNEREVDTLNVMVYDKVLTMWLQSEKLKVKESTYSRYVHLIDRHIRPALGHISTNHLYPEVIEEYISELLTNGRLDGKGGLSPKTVNDILTVVKSSVEHARRGSNLIICNLSNVSIKKEEKEIRILTYSEQKKLVSLLTADMTLCKLGILISLYTGLRIGEICALCWEDICLEKEIIKIRHTMQRIQNCEKDDQVKTKIIISAPKTKKSIRDIPIPKWLAIILKKYKTVGKAFVLTGNEQQFMEPRTLQNRFKKYVREVGISQLNYHALRHTFATRCIELEFDIKTLSEILGHANVNITLNRYVHPSFKLKAENMNKLLLPD